jgi:hypothetical protein
VQAVESNDRDRLDTLNARVGHHLLVPARPSHLLDCAPLVLDGAALGGDALQVLPSP